MALNNLTMKDMKSMKINGLNTLNGWINQVNFEPDSMPFSS